MPYRPLEDGCVRILHLQGADLNAIVTCTLQHVSLKLTRPPIYSTVSYSWGTESQATTILVDEEEVNVPLNAAEALRSLRSPDSSIRTLWIDSICIDQSNLEERGHQVAMMADIYSNANSNLIWLGEDDGTVTAALANIDTLTSDIMAQTSHLETFPLGPGPDHHLHQSSGINVHFDAQPIIQLLARPWFSRLWVVQEATLAKANLCHCGPFKFDLIPLLRVAKWLWTKRSHIELHDADNFREIRQIFAPVFNLYDLVDENLGWFHQAFKRGWFKDKDDTSLMFAILEMTADFNATQSVDHVFAILGLWLRFSVPPITLPSLLQSDYGKSVSDVFRDATRYVMMESESLALWHNLHHRPEDEELTLPTWVRRWDRSFHPGCDPTPFHRGTFAHGEWLQDKYDPAPGLPDSIMLEGVFVDLTQVESQLEVVSGAFSDVSFTCRFVNEVETMIHNRSRVRTVHGAELDLALRTVLVAAENAERDVATEDDLQGLNDLKEHFWSKGIPFAPNLTQLASDPVYATATAETRRAGRYGEAAWRVCYLRRFFVTAGGRIGLGPQTMQSGDFAVVIYGCEWPVILRRDDREGSGNAIYQLVGTAWIYGVMEGEAVQKHMATYGEEADEVFTII